MRATKFAIALVDEDVLIDTDCSVIAIISFCTHKKLFSPRPPTSIKKKFFVPLFRSKCKLHESGVRGEY
jgi:hypothetical protein